MPKKPITLDQDQLKQYVRLGASAHLGDETTPEDAHICRQLGLFFSVNTHLAYYAIDIESITLTPQPGDDTPPRAVVRINRKGHTYRLTSNDAGQVPDFPTRRRPRVRRQ